MSAYLALHSELERLQAATAEIEQGKELKQLEKQIEQLQAKLAKAERSLL